MWNRVRYSFWAPIYDAVARAASGFDAARRRSIERLHLAPGHRVLIVGAGTGLDLEYLPAGVAVTAVDVTPAMLKRLAPRAARRESIIVRLMDARTLDFPDGSFDAIIMHLILAVMPEPERGVREAVRVLKRGGRISVFDKFLRADEQPSMKRRAINVVAKPLFSDVNRRLDQMIAGTSLVLEHDEPVAYRGAYRIATLLKP